ncbi:hypothetical protein BZZ01_09570 [Nostocales cyanobacterium HT-58-2]|nr:hypothetical protein BZZ01_09570 [Nostocales cyanobacterium HT-58-2]
MCLNANGVCIAPSGSWGSAILALRHRARSAITLATFWLVSVGSEADATPPDNDYDDLPLIMWNALNH